MAIFILPSLSHADNFSWTNQTTGTGISGSNFYAITSSNNGQKLAAVVYGGDIFTSSDSGKTWTDHNGDSDPTGKSWYGVSSSGDGDTIVAISGAGDIYSSIDSGDTWNNINNTGDDSGFFRAVAVARNNGNIIAVADGNYGGEYGGDIFITTDGGVDWATTTPGDSHSHLWRGLTSSYDGNFFAVVGQDDDIYTYTGGGPWVVQTGTPSGTSLDWHSIASDSSGTNLIAVARNADIYTSVDSGIDWVDHNGDSDPTNKYWYSVTSSSNGDILGAVGFGTDMYTSVDGGTTWIDETAPGSNAWRSIASSADGVHLAAMVTNGGDIWTGLEVTAVPVLSITAPTSSLNTTVWRPVIDWDTSSTCYYSFGNSDPTNQVDCSKNGSDIPVPSVGSGTLNIKGTNHIGSDTVSTSFNYSPDFNVLGDPASYWKFDEASGTTAYDSFGNNDATVDGTPNWVSGKIGNAFSFDGSTYLAVNNPVSNDFTICSWIKTTVVGNSTNHWQGASIFDAEYPGLANDFSFSVDSNGHLMYGNGGSEDITINGDTSVNDNAWHYVCVDRTKSTGDVKLYVDNNLDAEGTTDSVSVTARPNARIGYGFDGAAYFTGLIDDLRIYNSAFSADDLTKLYNGTYDATTSSITKTITRSHGEEGSIQGRVNALLSLGNNEAAQNLINQYSTLFTKVTITNSTSTSTTTSSLLSQGQNLYLGVIGSEVRNLQLFLISQDKGPAAETLKKNSATAYFGKLTKAALVEFQKSVGINPSTGNFGPKTRAYLKSIGD